MRKAAGADRAPVRLPPPPVPGAQYVPAVRAGRLLFVSGHDPEARGRLRYRGRIGETVTLADGRRAARLATLNALAAVHATLGSLAAVRRCAVLTAYVEATAEACRPDLVKEAVDLVRRGLRGSPPPVVSLRPARGLSGGMPVEIELLLELRSATWRPHRPPPGRSLRPAARSRRRRPRRR
jgi:enamine deaminase RidA (YjgF/YER057c/UK114 family)